MKTTIEKFLHKNLISDSVLAKASGLSIRTILNVKRGIHTPRLETKRAFLNGLNKLLAENGQKAMGPQLFER